MPEPFSDNWTYLKVELSWLERLLLLAVTRQKKEAKEVDRIAQTRADRATAHWWKGIVSLDGLVAYDSPVAQKVESDAPKASYQQQIEARVKASQQQGTILALPALCDRLNLTPFEKNLILMAIAPEVHRRYAQLYEYLQGKDGDRAILPSIDLALRLFCRKDDEWKAARSSLTHSSPLIQHRLVELVFCQEAPLLNRLIKLSDSLVNFLLCDRPNLADLDQLLNSKKIHLPSPTFNSHPSTPHPFSDLILPDSLIETLQHFCTQMQFCSQVKAWEFEAMGILALMVGAKGTGKTIAAQTIAQTLQTPLMSVNLLEITNHSELLKEIVAESPKILFIKSAQIWLGRRSPLTQPEVHQFLKARQQTHHLTFLSVERLPAIQQAWKPISILQFPFPDANARSRLWQQAFSAKVPLDDIDWDFLAHKFPLTGGEIQTIARSAAFHAITDSSEPKIRMRHLLKALKK
jgi:ATPase family associated with various cellular activities (AAA)